MRVIIALVCLTAVALGEHCRVTSDCDTANCRDGMTPVCTDSNVCTCVMRTTTAAPTRGCTLRSDCIHLYLSGHCVRDAVHCVDGHCRCVHV